MRIVYKKMSSWPTGSLCRFCSSDSAFSVFLATSTQMFFQSFSSHRTAAVSRTILRKITSAISAAANSSKLEPLCFAASTINLQKERLSVQLKACASAPKPLSRCQHLILKQMSCRVFLLELSVGRFSNHQKRTSDTDRWGFFHP